jgi:hypothetical protein
MVVITIRCGVDGVIDQAGDVFTLVWTGRQTVFELMDLRGVRRLVSRLYLRRKVAAGNKREYG